MLTLERLDARIDALEETMNQGFLDLGEKMDELARMIAGGFKEVNLRIDRVEDRLDVVEGRLDVIEKNLITINDCLDVTAERTQNIEEHYLTKNDFLHFMKFIDPKK